MNDAMNSNFYACQKFRRNHKKNNMLCFNTLLLLTENTALPDFGQPKFGSYAFCREVAAEAALFRAVQETTDLLLRGLGRRGLT